MSPADSAAAPGTHQKTKVKAQAKAKSDKAKGDKTKTGDADGSDDEDQTFMTPDTGTTPKFTATKSDYIKTEGVSPGAEDYDDRLVTPAVDSEQEAGSVLQTPKKGKGKVKTADHVDDDSTPSKATPKKRTPKAKVKLEDAADNNSAPQTPTPKKRTRTVKPKDDAKLTPKRAMKADGQSTQGPGRGSFDGAIAASNRLQDMIFGSDEEIDVGDEATGAVREHEHVGVKETTRKIAQDALAAMARQNMVRQDGAHETLAHQNGMFNEEATNESQLAHQSSMFDQDAADDELFTRYTNMKEEEEA